MSSVIAVPDVSDYLRTLSDWIAEPDTRQWLQEAATEAIRFVEQSVLNDKTLRIPRQPAERAERFRVWLGSWDKAHLNTLLRFYRFRMAKDFQRTFESTLPRVALA